MFKWPYSSLGTDVILRKLVNEFMFADASLKVTSTGTLRILLMDFFEYITIGGTFDNDLVPSCLVRLSERSPVVVVGSENAFKEVHKKSQDIVYA